MRRETSQTGEIERKAQKRWRVINTVITFYVDFGLWNCEKVIIGRVIILAVFKLETDNPSSKSVKSDGKQMDKVRQIVHPKFNHSIFKLRHYLSDANYPTDNPSQTDNPSLV